MPTFQQGHIIWVDVSDSAGKNVKCRPVALITATDEIATEEIIVGVAITSTITEPIPHHFVILPWHRNGHVATGLKMRSAAVCDWLVEIEKKDIKQVIGIVPRSQLAEIIRQVRRLSESGA